METDFKVTFVFNNLTMSYEVVEADFCAQRGSSLGHTVLVEAARNYKLLGNSRQANYRH